MGQGTGIRKEGRAVRLIKDGGGIVAREGGRCMGDDRQATTSTYQGVDDAGGSFALSLFSLGFNRKQWVS